MTTGKLTAVLGGTRFAFGCATECLTAGDSGDDGDFGVGREGGGEAAGVAHVFVADEDVDVFADLAFFGDDAIANAGIERIQK